MISTSLKSTWAQIDTLTRFQVFVALIENALASSTRLITCLSAPSCTVLNSSRNYSLSSRAIIKLLLLWFRSFEHIQKILLSLGTRYRRVAGLNLVSRPSGWWSYSYHKRINKSWFWAIFKISETKLAFEIKSPRVKFSICGEGKCIFSSTWNRIELQVCSLLRILSNSVDCCNGCRAFLGYVQTL
jgi:hypothetical protein